MLETCCWLRLEHLFSNFLKLRGYVAQNCFRWACVKDEEADEDM